MLLARAKRGGYLALFPFFYAYVAYIFVGSASVYALHWLRPQIYHSAFWVYFLGTVFAEFAVIIEASDHIFMPYPALRQLGRMLAACLCGIFLCLYILPSIWQGGPPNIAIVNLSKRTALTKAALILSLMAAARLHRLPIGRNVTGILLGFSVYLGVTVANFELVEKFGPALYGGIFSILGPLSFSMALLIWTITLWRYEPVKPLVTETGIGPQQDLENLSYQLDRFNASLTKIVRR